jgi:CheY-like chemotaxis protein
VVVLMDINMPLLNGNKATALWRDLERALSVSVPAFIVAVAASSSVVAGEKGFDAVLPKPVRSSGSRTCSTLLRGSKLFSI